MNQPGHLLTLALVVCSLSACKRESYSEDPQVSPTSTPTPRQVCERLAAIIVSEIGEVDPSVQANTINECELEMVAEQQRRGDWDQISRCVMEAFSAEDIDRCDALYPGPAEPAGASVREEQACARMLALAVSEATAAGEIAESDIDEAALRAMNDECLAAFASDKQSMDPGQYEALIDCVLVSDSLAQMEQCG